MVKKEDLKEEFSKRLRAALLDAGVGGRGQAGRIREAMQAQGISVTEPGIWKWLNAAAIPDQTNILALSRWLNVRPEWLEYGRDEQSPPPQSIKESAIPPESEWGSVDAWDKNSPLNDDEVEVPFLKDIELACGDGSLNEVDYNGYVLRFSKATLRRVGAQKGGVLCFPAHGNSMEPLIPEGSVVAVNILDKKIVDGKVYAINQDGWKRLKVLHRTGPDKLAIRSFNSAEYPDEEADINSVEIIGRMFWTSTLW